MMTNNHNLIKICLKMINNSKILWIQLIKKNKKMFDNMQMLDGFVLCSEQDDYQRTFMDSIKLDQNNFTQKQPVAYINRLFNTEDDNEINNQIIDDEVKPIQIKKNRSSRKNSAVKEDKRGLLNSAKT